MESATLEAQLQQICTLTNQQDKSDLYKNVFKNLITSPELEADRIPNCKSFIDIGMCVLWLRQQSVGSFDIVGVKIIVRGVKLFIITFVDQCYRRCQDACAGQILYHHFCW